jgi:hypothetical protein
MYDNSREVKEPDCYSWLLDVEEVLSQGYLVRKELKLEKVFARLSFGRSKRAICTANRILARQLHL